MKKLTHIPPNPLLNTTQTQQQQEQKILRETKAILSLIYRSYLCSSEESRKLKIDDSIELKIKQKELNEKYCYENLFKKTK